MENIHTDLPLDWVPFRHKRDYSDNSIVSRVERNDLITKSALLKNSSLFLLAQLFTVLALNLLTLSPYCLPYSSYFEILENLVLDQPILPYLIFFFILITCLLDIVLMS